MASWTDAQIDSAATVAAEKANGGKFIDPLFYNPEQKAFWREVVRAALEAATARSNPPSGPKATIEEIDIFSAHCVYIRSVYTLAMRVWRDSNEAERQTMENVAPIFFEDVGQVLSEFLVNAACRITERAVDGRGNQNLSAELFLNNFSLASDTYKKLKALNERMNQHRAKILAARNKLGAHADREVIRAGTPLGAASWQDWDAFWSALEEFVLILNEQTKGKPFEIKASGVLGDAETLLKALKESRQFQALIDHKDSAIQKACQEVIALSS